MPGLQSAYLQCPYCWEQIEVVVDCSVRRQEYVVVVDCSVRRQEYVEDCSVCCRPIIIAVVSTDGEVVNIEGRSEDD